jgi:hypothetical protein
LLLLLTAFYYCRFLWYYVVSGFTRWQSWLVGLAWRAFLQRWVPSAASTARMPLDGVVDVDTNPETSKTSSAAAAASSDDARVTTSRPLEKAEKMKKK